MTSTAKQYNYCIDFFKGIACIFVVFMHCEFPGRLGIAVQAVSRFSVPFFFMVSGYFCFRPHQEGNSSSDDDRLKIRRKVNHIGKITLYASLFYIGFVLLSLLFARNQDLSVTGRSVFNWLVFNEPIKLIAHQYWFLFALLYAYIFYGILEYFNLRKFAYVLAALMFVAYFALAQGLHIAGIRIPNFYYRNWLVEAFPFFMSGHWIHENEGEINVSNVTLIAVIVVFTLLCLIERKMLHRDFGVNFCTIPQVFAMFVYGVENPTRHEGIIQRLGKDCSMLVYIFHPAVWHSLDGIYKLVGMSDNMPALYARPILCLVISILMALIFNAIVSSVDKRKLQVTKQQ